MSTIILSGIAVRDALLPVLIEKIKELSHAPTLAIIQVGERPDSASYIRAKKSLAQKIGVRTQHIQLPASVSPDDLIAQVRACNADTAVDGIIVQLPLPDHIERDAVISAVDPRKDADGLVAGSLVIPATARGVRELMKHYGITVSGKRVAVIGRSKLVGAPIAEMCRAAGAEVVVCHRGTPDLAKETRSADVILVAAGSAGLIGPHHVKEGAVVIDVGINAVYGEAPEGESANAETARKRLVGDADFGALQGIASAITPVPGGVGPMTVFALFENLVDLCTINQ